MYSVFMDDGLEGDFDLIQSVGPSLTQISVQGLVKGKAYRFYVQAHSFNEIGEASTIATLYACTPPSGLKAPQFVETSPTSMTLHWHEPTDNGGCPLLGYSLFRDDGLSSVPSIEVNSDNDPLVRNIPTLTTLTAQLDTANLGKKFRFVLHAYNREGMTSSVPISFLFSVVPETPSAGPEVLSFSSKSIRVRYMFA